MFDRSVLPPVPAAIGVIVNLNIEKTAAAMRAKLSGRMSHEHIEHVIIDVLACIPRVRMAEGETYRVKGNEVFPIHTDPENMTAVQTVKLPLVARMILSSSTVAENITKVLIDHYADHQKAGGKGGIPALWFAFAYRQTAIALAEVTDFTEENCQAAMDAGLATIKNPETWRIFMEREDLRGRYTEASIQNEALEATNLRLTSLRDEAVQQGAKITREFDAFRAGEQDRASELSLQILDARREAREATQLAESLRAELDLHQHAAPTEGEAVTSGGEPAKTPPEPETAPVPEATLLE